jgi:WD40 repeat protein
VAFAAASPAPAEPPHVDRHGDPLPPRALARFGTVRFRAAGAICALAYSPDGSVLASAGWDDAVRLWDPKTGAEVRTLAGAAGFPVVSLSFSPDGKSLVSGNEDGPVQVWDVASGKERRRLGAADDGLGCAAFSPDGKWIAAASGDRVRIWDAATGREQPPLVGHNASVQHIAYAPDGKSLATSDVEGEVLLWDVAARKPRLLSVALEPVSALAFSPDGTTLAGASGTTQRYWDLVSWKEVCAESSQLHPPREPIADLQYSPDGKLLAFAGEGRTLRVQGTGPDGVQFEIGGGLEYSRVAFSPDGKTLAAASGNAIILWDVEARRVRVPSASPYGGLGCVAFTPDGKQLAAGEGNVVHFCDAGTLNEERRHAWDEDQLIGASWGGARIDRLAFTADGKRFVAESGDRLLVCETEDGAIKDKWQNYLDGEWFARAAPDLKTVLAFSSDSVAVEDRSDPPDLDVRLWDCKKCDYVNQFRHIGGEVECVVFQPDGKRVAIVSASGPIRVYDPASGRRVCDLGEADAAAVWAEYAPDGWSLAALDAEGVFHVYELATRRQRCTFPVRPCEPFRFAMSPDRRMVAAWGDNDIHLWDLATGQARGCLTGHRGPIRQADFSPDGMRLASASDDATLLLWDISDFVKREQASPSGADLERLWQEIGAPDAARAFRAMNVLADAGDRAAAFLRERAAPPAVDAEGVRRLLPGLDAESFDDREEAARRLADLGDSAAPYLRDALKDDLTPEVRLRVLRLLARTEDDWSPGPLRTLRAIEVLEHIGSAEARRALERLADGPSGDRLTKQARASLERLDRRPAP